MLLHGYRLEMFRPKCNPNFESVHCVARLDQDISEALPYLSTALGRGDYLKSPPSLTLRVHGKLITLNSKEIFVNALSDQVEAEKIIGWLQKEINEAWDRRSEIEPTYNDLPIPQWLEILKLLPRDNCRKCGERTCTVFAVKAAQGLKDVEDCPRLWSENRTKLQDYLGKFDLDV